MTNFNYLHRIVTIIDVCEDEKAKADQVHDQQMMLACELSAYNTIKHIIEEYRKEDHAE